MCGCNKNLAAKGKPRVVSSKTTFSATSNQEVRPTPTFSSQSVSKSASKSVSGLNSEKRKIEKLRRDALAKHLGK